MFGDKQGVLWEIGGLFCSCYSKFAWTVYIIFIIPQVYNTIQYNGFCRKTGTRSVLMYGTYLNDVKLSIILRRSTILKEPTSVVERSAQALWIQEIEFKFVFLS